MISPWDWVPWRGPCGPSPKAAFDRPTGASSPSVIRIGTSGPCSPRGTLCSCKKYTKTRQPAAGAPFYFLICFTLYLWSVLFKLFLLPCRGVGASISEWLCGRTLCNARFALRANPFCASLYGKQNQLRPGAPCYFARGSEFYTDVQPPANRVRLRRTLRRIEISRTTIIG